MGHIAYNILQMGGGEKTMEHMTSVQAIRAFFEKDGGRRMALAELQALAIGERQELAALCAKELGVEVKITTPDIATKKS
jgi:hypothetical protein